MTEESESIDDRLIHLKAVVNIAQCIGFIEGTYKLNSNCEDYINKLYDLQRYHYEMLTEEQQQEAKIIGFKPRLVEKKDENP